MSINSTKSRMVSNAIKAISSAVSMAADIPEVPTGDDLQLIINASTQAQQAATQLRILEGFILGTRRDQ